MSAPQLQAVALGCTLGHRRLFSEVDFSLDRSQWLMLSGPNGSGKSTLLRMLAGLVEPGDGEIRWQGNARRATDPIWHAKLLYQGHSAGWKDQLSAAENLSMQSALDAGAMAASPQAIQTALERVGLGRQRRLPFNRLSAGQRRRLGLARLTLTWRPLWLLDEPTTALDTDGQQLFAQLLDEFLAEGGCAVIATHLPFPTRSDPLSLRLGGAQ